MIKNKNWHFIHRLIQLTRDEYLKHAYILIFIVYNKIMFNAEITSLFCFIHIFNELSNYN